ncbi:MAG: dual specificity protein phosphatase family protein [Spirochaetota bacterium]
MQSYLVTQCLQNDFVRLLDKYDPLPNYLHIGYDEANRLLGERVEEGPVAQIIRWAYGQGEEQLKIIHIRDWHDAADAEQQAHLAQFGAHCLRDTDGADFVFNRQIVPGRKAAIVDASGLNDFYKTDLAGHLTGCVAAPCKIGLIGVWTEAKITYLAYELTTRYPKAEIITCSALTASSSRSQHFIALDHLKKILGVKVFDSVASFAEYLGGSGHGLTASAYAQNKQLDNAKFRFNIPYELKEADNKILHYLFRESKSADFICLDGGFSGNVVLKAESRDAYGQKQQPTVVKIGQRDPISRERASFERIQEVLGNSAPAVVDFAEFGERGGIKYRYAAMTDGKVKTFQKYFGESEDIELLKKFLHVVFRRQLGRFYEAAVQENLNLLEYYDFRPRYADSVRKKCAELSELRADGRLQIAPGIDVEDVSRFYAEDLQHLRETVAVPRYISWLHGDLNGANIIIDESQNVWLIDFFHTHRGHALKDLVKLENDILFIFTKIEGEADLSLACQATDWLYYLHDLAVPPQHMPAPLAADARFAKSLAIIGYLRSFYRDIIDLDRDPYQFFVAAARYAMHTLSFDECNLWQRKWALYAGAKAIAAVRDALTRTARLRIDFMTVSGEAASGDASSAGLIGMTILPGRKDRGRDLASDLEEMRKQKVSHIATLISNAEFGVYGVGNLLEAYKAAGFDVIHRAVKDQGVPTRQQAEEVLGWIKERTDRGERVAIHCVGGLGRTGIVAALFLKQFAGLGAEQAIERVRQVRSPRAVENQEQENFIKNF